jgi:hypothetical protein
MRGERNEEKKRKERGRESRTCGARRVVERRWGNLLLAIQVVTHGRIGFSLLLNPNYY